MDKGKAVGGNEARFTGKVDSYKRFRPGYPRGILNLLANECALTPQSAVVDIAAGTGRLTELFLEYGNTVTAIEPNEEMRTVCFELQSRYPHLTVVDGTAEITGLSHHSSDFLTVAQALHWFDLPASRREFIRILRPSGWCVVVYNEHHMTGDRFHESYEAILLRYGIDYTVVRRQHLDERALRAFFEPYRMHRHSFPNTQTLDREALLGRILSSSYIPNAVHPTYSAMLTDIDRLFSENQKNGYVYLDYECIVSYGQLS